MTWRELKKFVNGIRENDLNDFVLFESYNGITFHIDGVIASEDLIINGPQLETINQCKDAGWSQEDIDKTQVIKKDAPYLSSMEY